MKPTAGSIGPIGRRGTCEEKPNAEIPVDHDHRRCDARPGGHRPTPEPRGPHCGPLGRRHGGPADGVGDSPRHGGRRRTAGRRAARRRRPGCGARGRACPCWHHDPRRGSGTESCLPRPHRGHGPRPAPRRSRGTAPLPVVGGRRRGGASPEQVGRLVGSGDPRPHDPEPHPRHCRPQRPRCTRELRRRNRGDCRHSRPR